MIEHGVIHCGDCLELMRGWPDGCFDWVITDPPYPDYHRELYGYHDGILDCLKLQSCRQLIFWSAKVDFPLDYTACHVWDKRTGAASQYEFIYERNGQNNYQVFRHYLINSIVAANYEQDIFTGHPSQKPWKLLAELIGKFTQPHDLILDPFCGSGSTLVAAERLGRRWVGIDIDPHWCEVARKRTAQRGLFCQRQ